MNDLPTNTPTNVSLRDTLLLELKKCGEKNPNLRFGQMLALIIRNGKYQFEIPDIELIEKVKSFYEELP